MANHFTSPSTFIDAVVWVYVCFDWPSSVRRCIHWSQISARRSNTKLQQFHRLYTPQMPSFIYCFNLVFTNKHLYNIVHQKFHCRIVILYSWIFDGATVLEQTDGRAKNRFINHFISELRITLRVHSRLFIHCICHDYPYCFTKNNQSTDPESQFFECGNDKNDYDTNVCNSVENKSHKRGAISISKFMPFNFFSAIFWQSWCSWN